ncbi:hypothetical protein N7539_008788 [Penicillium diatomitis]|uniref:Isopenicillin N synthase-like Fe(2+) 2OG dioxygenase domain-containing protein n=1 Tax=Penicillium diatomitis TaxID=2819901 RepID=A0A9X0BLM0_9EURO|nr:uncharacterized protein N7539_008788 [Penicillium diatomitis]KAJ5471845.1 hypothetical protein N7539_008788 [Penicillium diatomitis]
MCAALPLINLSKPISKALSSELRASLYRFGAFRLAAPAPKTTQRNYETVVQKAQEFFQQPVTTKMNLTEYSAFASERVRGETAIYKESTYYFRNDVEPNYSKGPSDNLFLSVKALHEEWTPIRLDLLNTLSQVLWQAPEKNIPLTGDSALNSTTVGVHYYDSSRCSSDCSYYLSLSHKDSGTLTILFRSHDKDDGLEIADLKTTEKRGSEGVGSEASFIPVPTPGNDMTEVVVFAGIKLQNLFGRDRVRACVHRVRGPSPDSRTKSCVRRLSIAMFCAPSTPATPITPPSQS